MELKIKKSLERLRQAMVKVEDSPYAHHILATVTFYYQDANVIAQFVEQQIKRLEFDAKH